MINVKEINSISGLESFIDNSPEVLHIVKLGAQWCGPCKTLSQTISNLDPEKINGALFAEIDVDENDDTEDISVQYKIRNIPVLVFIKDKKEINRSVGSISANDIYNLINNNS